MISIGWSGDFGSYTEIEFFGLVLIVLQMIIWISLFIAIVHLFLRSFAAYILLSVFTILILLGVAYWWLT